MISLFTNVFVAMFVVLDPFGNVPFFLALTHGMSKSQRRATVRRAMITATIILIVFALLGEVGLSLLGVSVEAFQIAGGLLLLAVAFDMLLGTPTRRYLARDEERGEVAITPMATPLIAGPGSMATALVFMSNATTPVERAVVIAAVLLALAISFPILYYGDWVLKVIERGSMTALTKIMGIILATIAVELAISGFRGAFGII